MKFTFSWLKEHLATDASIDAIVETMTMTGLEVEGVENAGEKLGAFTVMVSTMASMLASVARCSLSQENVNFIA